MRDAARRRCRRPPARGTRGVLLANNPRTERTIAHHDRSIVHVRSSPPPWVARRSEGGGGESVINRFAAVPSGLVRGGVDASSPVSSSRDAAVRTSLPPHRDGGERAVHPSARRPVARLLESRYLILSYLSATSKKEKRKTNRARFSVARAGGRLRFRNDREEPVAALVRAPTRRIDRDRGAGMQKYPAPDDVTARRRAPRHP